MKKTLILSLLLLSGCSQERPVPVDPGIPIVCPEWSPDMQNALAAQRAGTIDQYRLIGSPEGYVPDTCCSNNTTIIVNPSCYSGYYVPALYNRWGQQYAPYVSFQQARVLGSVRSFRGYSK